MLMLMLMLMIEIPLANAQRSTPNAQLKRTAAVAKAMARQSTPKWPKFSSLDVRQRFAHYS